MLAGFIAVLIAWMINSLYTYRFGLKGLSIAGPALEEILKTGGAILLQSNIIIAHAVFGVVEAIRDIHTKRGNLAAGLAGILGHLLFGSVSLYAYREGNIFSSLTAGIALHITWNIAIIYLVQLKNKES